MDDKQGFRSWFIVWNNPIDTIGDLCDNTPECICEYVLSLFIGDDESRSGAVAYCVSAQGLHHLHIVACSPQKMRFSAIKKIFPKAHLEPTRGSKKQADDYINKRGGFEEKGEKVLYVAQRGQITSNQGNRTDLHALQALIDNGYTPEQIFSKDISYRRYSSMVKEAFFSKRRKETSFIRDIRVYWHFGFSGSGKSYCAKKIIDLVGEDNLYFLSDYEGGGFDNYNGEKVLFLDEFKGQLRFSTLLTILDKYKTQIHSRYSNIWTLWEEVHITSVYAPEEIYQKMVLNDKVDSISQLLRRITEVVYHFVEDGEYKEKRIEASKYKDRSSLTCGFFVDVSIYDYLGDIPFIS